MDKLLKHLRETKSFETAHKRPRRYVAASSIAEAKKNSFFIHSGEPTEVVTKIGDEKETVNTARNGDYVISGPVGEQYVVKAQNVPKLYNMIDGALHVRPTERKVARITATMFKKLSLPAVVTFQTSWGETMILRPGDYLVKDGKNYYRIEQNVFKQTYAWGESASPP